MTVLAGVFAVVVWVTTGLALGVAAAWWHADGVAALAILGWLAFSAMNLVLFEATAFLATAPDATLDMLQITDGEIGPFALIFLLVAALFTAVASVFSAEGRRGIAVWIGQAVAGMMSLALIHVGLAAGVVVSGLVGAGVGMWWP